MNLSIQLKTSSAVTAPLCRGVFFLCCVALSAEAVTPAPDGGYPNGNTAEGSNALFSLTTGTKNTADGYLALFFNTTGRYNTATGAQALYSNTTGVANTANGMLALLHNTSGGDNTANGYGALYSNTTGYYNTADGYQALDHNTIGGENTANGSLALFNNTTGSYNTANGYQALYSNIDSYNTATGYQALYRNTFGENNTANGAGALFTNAEGYENTATGSGALYYNTAGANNTANGASALYRNTTGGENTAIGIEALLSNTTGGGNIALGWVAGDNLTTGNNNIDIGNEGVAGESGIIRIGTAGSQTATFIAGIYGVNEGGTPSAVYISSNGQLGTMSSSRRFKKEIKPMNKASEAILALKPVTFHYKSDATGTPQFGLIAEEVAEVSPDLVVRDKDGEIYTVRYDAVNAMLLNEFLKEHRKVEEQERKGQAQEATIAQLKKDFHATAAWQQEEIKAFTASLKEQARQIQNVSAQLEPSKPAPQTAANSQ
jgi:hypothetical protein